jgi:ATP-dependent RNA helicase DOB1
MDELFDVFDDPNAGEPLLSRESNKSRKKANLTELEEIVPNDKKKSKLNSNSEDAADNDDDVEIDDEKIEEDNEEEEEEGEAEPEEDEDFGDEDINQKLAKLAPKASIFQLETPEGCLHEVVAPIDVEYNPLRDPFGSEHFKAAKEYVFKIDPFQKEAILCIENNQSVLVSAHTSAGKTVVAEYAIALSLKNKQRVIYTTPIKALSNQKYREFYEEFQDVGLITGDVTINPNASCLIMTTEILRLMLFRGNEIMREVGWVIFDEIHYMRDKERGVVWEETIILLPDNVHYVFLSATIPNARQFAEWISHLHHQVCHVVYTDYRPTPLQHYIYPSGGEGLHLVVDEQGKFREDNFNTAMNVLLNVGDAAKGDQMRGRGRKFSKGGESNCFKVVRTIMEKDLAPVIIFSFSKKDCEAYALQMSKLDFNTGEEKKLVEEVFRNAIDVLGEEDKQLPQVEHVLPLLKRGIGIHHSGLLPIVKETIEILFGEGLIKALFATETFAMGLNMPARTVLFTNARKFDGRDFRWITSGEYIQMSGRAGRRGIDDKGIVILMVDEKLSPTVGKDLIKGKPDAINSAFHLTYNMVLNLLRVEDVNPEYMLQHSFYQFQHYAEVPKILEKLREHEQKHAEIVIENEKVIQDYFKIQAYLKDLSEQYLAFVQKAEHIVPFIQPGRLVKIRSDAGVEVGWGSVVNFQKKKARQSTSSKDEIYVYTIDVLITLDKKAFNDNSAWMPSNDEEQDEIRVISIGLKHIVQISSVRLYNSCDLKSYDGRQSVKKSIRQAVKQFDGSIPLLDPIQDMRIRTTEFKEIITKIESYELRLKDLGEMDGESVVKYQLKDDLNQEMNRCKTELRKAQSLLQHDELKCRKRVLRRLGYCSNADVIDIKGRVACEITSGDELLITEMLFNGLFNDLTPGQIAALLSCFVFEEKAEQMPKLGDELSQPLKQMQDLAKRIAAVSNEAKLEINEEEYINSFKPNLMDVIFAWSNGATFAQLCKMTDVFEGSIIRCMRRLEELMRQMCQAAKVIGNTDLENKFAEADKSIKRGIVFAASLYL